MMTQPSPTALFERSALVRQLASQPRWDSIVMGGGATGLGVALDAISRGYKTLLLEQADYAKGTSSRRTRLVHGRVRYTWPRAASGWCARPFTSAACCCATPRT